MMTEALDRRIVAVMFTDMVGYSALMGSDETTGLDKRDRYVRALETQHAKYGGTIVQRLGDGSMSMFASTVTAVQTAVALQQELTASGVNVRIGLHVGEVIVEPERLTGEAVNIASRVESFAPAGAVILSDAAYEQIKNRGDLAVKALGRFRFKNVGRPFELYAVVAPGLAVPDEAALEGKGETLLTVSAQLPEVTTLFGRSDDLSALAELVGKHRLVTITGPGGVGKTTVMVDLGHALAAEFPDGLAFASLAEVVDPSEFLPSLAATLDVKEAEARSPFEGIVALIGERKALLLLDNLEQIVEAAPDVAGLLRRCPALRVIVTSRTPLGIGGEREYQLQPLRLPEEAVNKTPEELIEAPAVRLFVERAQAALRTFRLTPENGSSVAGICARLDGLPLALELAAVRVRLLSPEALLGRLDQALKLLTAGPRDLPARQKTLRATIDWSHSLLDEPEQRLFRRLSVFIGGCAIEAIEGVCGDPGESVLDELDSLVAKALVTVEGKDQRFRMLQTISEYAKEQLEASEESAQFMMRHAIHYAGLARQIRDGIEGSEQIRSVERGIADEGNLQAALETFLAAARQGDGEACDAGMQMTGDLWLYWHIRGKNLSARDYASAFFETDATGTSTVARAGALITAGLASWMAGELDRSVREWTEAVRIAQELDAGREQCIAAFALGLGYLMSDADAGLRWTADSIERCRELRFTWGLGIASTIGGLLAMVANDLELARRRFEESWAIQKRLGDHEGGGMSLGGMAQLAWARGDAAAAFELFGQALAEFEAVGDLGEVARILSETAWSYLENGEPARARQYFLDSIRAHTELASIRGVGLSMIGLAAAEFAEGRPERAVEMAAAAEVYAREEGIVVVYSDDTPGERYIKDAMSALDPEALERASARGRALSVKEVIEMAREAKSVGVGLA